MVKTPSSVALDSNVLYDLAAQEEFALAGLEVLKEQGIGLFIPLTVFIELEFEIRHGQSPQKAARATRAMENIPAWKMKVMRLDPHKMGIAHEFSKAIRNAQLLPYEECNDGDILGEATQHPVEFLLTSDKHLLKIDRDQLQALYRSKHLPKVEIVSPWRFFTALNKRQ
jgi:hypothetical protein